MARSTVEETLNAMLDAEAGRLCRAERYERAEARKDTRASSYAVLLYVSTRALAEFAHEQPARTFAARSATKNAGRGSVPGRQVNPEAGGGTAAPCGRHEVGHTAVSGREPPLGSERSRMNAHAKTFGSPDGEPSTTRPYISKNVRKTLDSTTSCGSLPHRRRCLSTAGINRLESCGRRCAAMAAGAAPVWNSANCGIYWPKLYKYIDLPTISCGVQPLSQANEPFFAYSKVRYRTLIAT